MIILYWRINVLCVFGVILYDRGYTCTQCNQLCTGNWHESTNNLEYDLSAEPTISILANTHKPHSIP